MFHFKQVSKIPAFHLSPKQIIVSPRRCFSATDIKQLRESENFTFDWKKVKSTPDEEREDLIKFKEMFKIDEDFQQEHQRRQYVVSKDPTEWSFVERLISQTKPKTVPVPKVNGTIISMNIKYCTIELETQHRNRKATHKNIYNEDRIQYQAAHPKLRSYIH